MTPFIPRSFRHSFALGFVFLGCGSSPEATDDGTSGTDDGSTGASSASSATSATSATTATTATGVDSSEGDSGTAPTSVGTDSSDGGTDDTGGEGPLPLGDVEGGDVVPCPPDDELPMGAECRAITVVCPGVDDIDALVAVVERDASTGTIVVHGGGGGTQFFDRGLSTVYSDASFRVVLVRWDADWEQSQGGGIKAAACRPATLFDWVHTEIHADDPAGYCAQGHSGGSGAIAYSLAHYGLESTIDHALVSASTPFARIDYGCAPELLETPPSPCAEIPDAPYAYGGAAVMIDSWEGTQGCGMPDADAATIAAWESHSIVSEGADWDYATTIDAWLCANQPNETTGQGALWFDAVQSEVAVTCVQEMLGNMACMGEAVFADPGAYAMMTDAMIAACVP